MGNSSNVDAALVTSRHAIMSPLRVHRLISYVSPFDEIAAALHSAHHQTPRPLTSQSVHTAHASTPPPRHPLQQLSSVNSVSGVSGHPPPPPPAPAGRPPLARQERHVIHAPGARQGSVDAARYSAWGRAGRGGRGEWGGAIAEAGRHGAALRGVLSKGFLSTSLHDKP